MSSLLVAALGLGLFGSLHCALMCGPLLLAGCSARPARDMAGYFGGRLLAYMLSGALFGALGAHAAERLSLPAVQRGLLFAVALLALGRGVALLARRRPALVQLRKGREPRGGAARLRAAARFVAVLLPRRALPLGLATGLLPCGLLAGGWALAAASGKPHEGALVMACLWLATSPALLATVLAAGPMKRLASPLWSGLSWCALAVWIAARPLFELAHACH